MRKRAWFTRGGRDGASPEPARISREKRTIAAMVRIYCRNKHQGAAENCADCRDLLDYAVCRLDRCPFGASKPTCVDCPIHCYKPAMRERVREVMRFAGPRMLWRHPVLAVRHLLDGRRGTLAANGPDTSKAGARLSRSTRS